MTASSKVTIIKFLRRYNVQQICIFFANLNEFVKLSKEVTLKTAMKPKAQAKSRLSNYDLTSQLI